MNQASACASLDSQVTTAWKASVVSDTAVRLLAIDVGFIQMRISRKASVASDTILHGNLEKGHFKIEKKRSCIPTQVLFVVRTLEYSSPVSPRAHIAHVVIPSDFPSMYSYSTVIRHVLHTPSGLPSLPGFSSASQTAPLPTSELVNLISSTAELQLVPTQTTRMQQTVAISLPLTSVLQLLPSPVSMATSTPPTSRTVEVQTTPIVVPNRDREKGMTIYIIIGAVVVAVLFVLTALVIFALIMVANRRHLKKKALKEQERSGAFSGILTMVS